MAANQYNTTEEVVYVPDLPAGARAGVITHIRTATNGDPEYQFEGKAGHVNEAFILGLRSASLEDLQTALETLYNNSKTAAVTALETRYGDWLTAAGDQLTEIKS